MQAPMTNLDVACRAFGWAGGTIHQVAQEVGVSGCGSTLVGMPPADFQTLLRAALHSRATLMILATEIGERVADLIALRALLDQMRRPA